MGVGVSGRYDRPLTPEQIAAVTDEGIDFSDIPELDEVFWERAEFVEPDRTDQMPRNPTASPPSQPPRHRPYNGQRSRPSHRR